MSHSFVLVVWLAAACGCSSTAAQSLPDGDAGDATWPVQTDEAGSDSLSGQCVLSGGVCTTSSSSGQCFAYSASPYDGTRSCVVSGHYVTIGCCDGDYSCSASAAFSCIKRILADGGEELLQSPSLPWKLADGFAGCGATPLAETVALARACP